mmetsp:Transcript_12372/g.15779  ORF Transcript_12372/g.15779 Transcript_12372/m.15779 type:complete len:192 (+) Transcript_12372:11-586(+)
MKKGQTASGVTQASVEDQLAQLRTKEDMDKCVDLNFMVFNYGKFHNNFVNQVIHIVFVPIILYTWYVQMCHVAPSYDLGFAVPLFGDKIGFGFVPNIVVSTAYYFVDWKVALAVSAWWWPCMFLGNASWMMHSEERYFGMDQFWFMGLVNICSWIAQFIGHGVFEKRAPAIKTNLGFALLAPFFITFEVMN